MKKKILIVTPRSPFQGRGADELDRLTGIKWFINHGYEVRVITKTMPSDVPFIDSAKSELGIPITQIPYKFNLSISTYKKIKIFLKRIINPLYWDGASYEYFDPEIQQAFVKEIIDFKPDIVWFDYTYLWPLYDLVPKKIPIYTRSINFEPVHFLDEDGRWPWNYIRVIPKFVSEYIISKKSKVVFAITPKEEKDYSLLGANTATLPLRGLISISNMETRIFSKNNVIHLGFTASTYSVHHNLKALLFILKGILPILRKGGVRYVFHFTGSRLPEYVLNNLGPDDIYEGFVTSIVDFWKTIDIALVPSLFGAGMQQKIFEPLYLGIPTITSERAMAGYPFGKNEVVFATSVNDFVIGINDLVNNVEKMKSLSVKSRELSEELFGESKMTVILKNTLE